MPKSLPREVIHVQQEWPIAQVIQALRMALDGQGPALAFGPITHSHVAKNIAVIIPTSGSTGMPKEVALTSKALIASAKAAHKYLKAKKNERWSLLLPISHIAGVNVLVRSIYLQSEIIDLRGKNTKGSAEYTSIVPTQLYRALNGDSDLLEHLQSAKAVLVGGSPTSDDLLEHAKSKNINVITTYGMSEMSGGCVYNNTPLIGVEVEIRADQRIALRGPMQASEYLGSENRLSDEDGWFLTSDAGYIESRKLFVTGRVDDQIISGGEKISLSTIDDYLNTHTSLRFMSCAVASQEWGEQLCLASSSNFDEKEISQLLRDAFGGHAVPKLFLKSIHLPETSLGKADRATLSKRFEMIRL